MRSLPHVRFYATTGTIPKLIRLDQLQDLNEACAKNSTLAKLRNAYVSHRFEIVDDSEECTPSLNSVRSLPMTEFPKNKIFEQVTMDSNIADWRKPITKWYRLGKSILKSYSTGIRAMWNIHRDSKKIIKKYGSPEQLNTNIFRTIEFQEIEMRLKRAEDIKFPLSRAEFQECHRRAEFWKLPSFIVLFIIFEEMLPVICYLAPTIVPWNCLTPGALKKISDRRAIYTHDYSVSEIPRYQSPYMVKPNDLMSVLLKCKLIPKWRANIYKWSDNKAKPCEILTNFHQYLFVDDWLLLRHIMSDEVTKLSERELVNAILERQLFKRGEDLNTMVKNKTSQKVLVWRLMIYWAFRFDGTITASKDALFSEKWGVNNVAILNFPGSAKLLEDKQLKNIQ
ncbi:LAFE_0E05732g1_1 [Lachancea fermentati]|uniref:LAFE_0E05732g1_1 n=1 Tax=Lachancea fermentati TaxID=4955 RepID=A0A1G4MDC3_LACFM|nr:LAFE_0E05732g1_1 [Lachancea fermentati]